MENKQLAVSDEQSALSEFLERTHNYAWGEMTLLEQTTLREQAATELAALRAQLQEQREINKTIAAQVQKGARDGYAEVIDTLKSQLAAVTAERDVLRDFYESVKATINDESLSIFNMYDDVLVKSLDTEAALEQSK